MDLSRLMTIFTSKVVGMLDRMLTVDPSFLLRKHFLAYMYGCITFTNEPLELCVPCKGHQLWSVREPNA